MSCTTEDSKLGQHTIDCLMKLSKMCIMLSMTHFYYFGSPINSVYVTSVSVVYLQ